jgi:hypothetical protein
MPNANVISVRTIGCVNFQKPTTRASRSRQMIPVRCRVGEFIVIRNFNAVVVEGRNRRGGAERSQRDKCFGLIDCGGSPAKGCCACWAGVRGASSEKKRD